MKKPAWSTLSVNGAVSTIGMPLRSPIRPPQGTRASTDRLAPPALPRNPVPQPCVTQSCRKTERPERLVYVTCPMVQLHRPRIRDVGRFDVFRGSKEAG